MKEPFNCISQLFCGLFCGSMEQGVGFGLVWCDLVWFGLLMRAKWVKLVQETSRWYSWVRKVRCTEVCIMWFHLCKTNETKIWTFKYVLKWLCEHRKSILGYRHQTVKMGWSSGIREKPKQGWQVKKEKERYFLTKNTKKQHCHVIWVKEWTLLN